MAKKDNRIDVYIANAREFAQPILEHLRSVIHKASPGIEEAVKWGVPHFLFAGKIVCGMAAFKAHCAFSFRQAALMKDPHRLFKTAGEKSGMGNLGQIKSLKDLPSPKMLIEYIREAISLIQTGAKLPKPATSTARKVIIPKYFLVYLKKNQAAYRAFEKFSYSHRKEYVEWISGAKTEATREKRMNTAIEWLQEGKSMNWKYERSKNQKA